MQHRYTLRFTVLRPLPAADAPAGALHFAADDLIAEVAAEYVDAHTLQVCARARSRVHARAHAQAQAECPCPCPGPC